MMSSISSMPTHRRIMSGVTPAWNSQIEQICTMLCVIEFVGNRLVDWHRHGIGGRV